MSGDRIRICDLATEWGPEIGIPYADHLARALTEAAIAGEFDHLPPANRASLFDERPLIHIPIRSGKLAYPERLILFAIRGMGFIHRDAVEAFAKADGRGYPLLRRWAAEDVKTASPGRETRLDAVVSTLKSLYPNGRGHASRQTMADAASKAIGETVSFRAIDRATNLVWPRAKQRHD